VLASVASSRNWKREIERERWKKIVVVVVVVVVSGVIAATTISLDVKFAFSERKRK